MCECLSYEDGDRYQCAVCADISRGIEAGVPAAAVLGRAVLKVWWENDCGDIDGGDIQEWAEEAGLWHRVERHADGVEREWCGNDGSGCGELTEAGLAVLAEEGK